MDVPEREAYGGVPVGQVDQISEPGANSSTDPAPKLVLRAASSRLVELATAMTFSSR